MLHILHVIKVYINYFILNGGDFMNTSNDLNRTGSSLLVQGAVFLAIVLLWPIFMTLSKITGDIQEQLLVIAERRSIYILNFVIASLIAPALSLIMVTLSFYVPTKKKTPILSVFGIILLAPYLTLVSIAYTSQYTILQSFITEGNLPLAELWYLDNLESIPYFINQLGYTFFALSAILIGFKFLYERGIPKTIGVLLWLSGTLSIIAFVGLTLGNKMLNFSTIISGMLTIPIGILVMIWGVTLKRQDK